MTRDLLIIMARYPTPGKVKTRLAAEIGNRAAARFYRRLLDHHAREFRDAPFAVEWRYTPARAPFSRIVGQGARLSPAVRRNGRDRQAACPTVVPQPPGHLGARMRRSFGEAFARGYRRVVMIGTDCPTMTRRTVGQALRRLHNHDAVFQPTDDGGYALVGLRRMVPIFSGITWSSDRVMVQTRRRLQSRGVSFTELAATFDVDTAADLNRLKKGFQ